MRIIITRNGEQIIKEIEDEDEKTYHNNFLRLSRKSFINRNLPSLSNNGRKLISQKFYSPSSDKSLYSLSSSFKKNNKKNTILFKNSLSDYFNRDETKINKSELHQAKKIKIIQHKISMSPVFLDKYTASDNIYSSSPKGNNNNFDIFNNDDNNNKDDNNNENNEFASLFNNNNNINSNTNNKINSNSSNIIGNNQKKKIKLKEIISPAGLARLKEHLSKTTLGSNDVRLPLDQKNKTSFNFRSKYEDKQKTQDNLDLILNYDINGERKDLIKYLKEKKNLAPFYLEALMKSDEWRVYKLNKMCGLIYSNKNEEEKNSLIRRAKSNLNYNFEYNKKSKKTDKENINKLLYKQNNIFEDYCLYKEKKQKVLKRIYKEALSKTKQNFWNKFNCQKYGKIKFKNIKNDNINNSINSNDSFSRNDNKSFGRKINNFFNSNNNYKSNNYEITSDEDTIIYSKTKRSNSTIDVILSKRFFEFHHTNHSNNTKNNF